MAKFLAEQCASPEKVAGGGGGGGGDSGTFFFPAEFSGKIITIMG